jgi:hypothetical protein
LNNLINHFNKNVNVLNWYDHHLNSIGYSKNLLTEHLKEGCFRLIHWDNPLNKRKAHLNAFLYFREVRTLKSGAAMAQTAGRTYTMGNDVMLERARVFRDRLSVELPDFTARFPWLDAAWAAAFEAEIAAADAFPSDLSVRLDMKVVTGDLLDAMQRGHAALRVLSGYAALAWPADRSRQRAFGQDKWKAAQQSTLRLAEALELAHATAQDPDFKPQPAEQGLRPGRH